MTALHEIEHFCGVGILEKADLLKAQVDGWLENPPENLPLPAIQRLHDAYSKYGWPRICSPLRMLVW